MANPQRLNACGPFKRLKIKSTPFDSKIEVKVPRNRR